MGFAISLILVSLGSILTWAVNASVRGVNIHVVGVILIVVGLIGFLASLLLLSAADERNRRWPW